MSDTLFKNLAAAPGDPILSISEKFRADTRPEKVNLSVGVYLDESGKTPILDVVTSEIRPILCPVSVSLISALS